MQRHFAPGKATTLRGTPVEILWARLSCAGAIAVHYPDQRAVLAAK